MSLQAARKALIERQGSGARYDAPSAPAHDLLLARRLTAAFARHLNDLPDAELATPARAGVVAQIALDARHMSQFIAAIRSGVETPRLLHPTREDVEQAMSLPPHALRHLFDHTRVHLNVEWRDMTDDDWARPGTDDTGEKFDMADLPRRRANQLQVHLQGLANP